MVKVKSGLSGLSIAQTIVVGRTPLVALNGNPNFPNPPYSIPELEAEYNALAEFQRSYVNGIKTVKPMRDVTFKSFKTKMALTADYVNVVAKGDMPMLETSGLELVKPRAAATVPGIIHRISSCNCAENGAVRVMWSGIKGKSYYIVQSTTDPTDDNSWKQVEQASTVHCEVYGLEVGKFAHFRVCAVNSAGRGEWSDVAKVMVA